VGSLFYETGPRETASEKEGEESARRRRFTLCRPLTPLIVEKHPGGKENRDLYEQELGINREKGSGGVLRCLKVRKRTTKGSKKKIGKKQRFFEKFSVGCCFSR